MTLSAAIRESLPDDPSHLFRRYFVNTLFDSNFIVLGIMAAEAFEEPANPGLALGTLFAALTAIGISTGVSVLEAEHVEDELSRRKLERAMLRSLEGSAPQARARRQRYLSAAFNFTAPFVVLAVTGAPIALHLGGLIGDFKVAAAVSSALALAMIFGAGYALGRLAGLNPLAKALRMTLVAGATFAVLYGVERFV